MFSFLQKKNKIGVNLSCSYSQQPQPQQLLGLLFYSYAYSIYKRDKTGERDYEKYSNLVHDDSSVSSPLEERKKDKDIDNKEK